MCMWVTYDIPFAFVQFVRYLNILRISVLLERLYVFICVMFLSDHNCMRVVFLPSPNHLSATARVGERGTVISTLLGDLCLACRCRHAGHLVIVVRLELWSHRYIPQNPVSSSMLERS